MLKDLRVAESVNHLPQVPAQVVQVGLASPDTAGLDEWDLDTQMSTGMAGNVAKLIIYDTTSLTDSDVALMFNKFTHQNIAKAGSASFGLCETFAFLDGSMLADDQVFLEAAAQGKACPPTFRDALETQRVCDAVLKSAKNNGCAEKV